METSLYMRPANRMYQATQIHFGSVANLDPQFEAPTAPVVKCSPFSRQRIVMRSNQCLGMGMFCNNGRALVLGLS